MINIRWEKVERNQGVEKEKVLESRNIFIFLKNSYNIKSPSRSERVYSNIKQQSSTVQKNAITFAPT